MMEPHQAALAVKGVGYSYGERRALQDVTLEVPPGTFTVLLGLNGAGKSTLFSLITRLYDTREGEILVFGHNVLSAPGEALRRLGVVFQARTLDLDLSILQNLSYHAALHGMGRREARQRAQTLLASLDLAERGRDKVRNLSGGQMRRVEIARALLHDPRLLLLDEATVGLDIRSRAEIIAHVRALVAEKSVGVLWATHLIDEVSTGDHVVILHQGRVRAAGSVANVVAAAGKEDIRGAFAKLTGLEQGPSASEAA